MRQKWFLVNSESVSPRGALQKSCSTCRFNKRDCGIAFSSNYCEILKDSPYKIKTFPTNFRVKNVQLPQIYGSILRPKICGNYQFTENFPTRKLGGKIVFDIVSCKRLLLQETASTNLWNRFFYFTYFTFIFNYTFTLHVNKNKH